MFGMEDPVAGSPDLTLIVVEHPSLAQILKIAFGAVWASGLTFEQADERLDVSRRRAPPDACRRSCRCVAAGLSALAGRGRPPVRPTPAEPVAEAARRPRRARGGRRSARPRACRASSPGYRPGELPFFALLDVPNDDARTRRASRPLGARVLRSYRSSPPSRSPARPVTVLRVAALPWVSRLAPVEVVAPSIDEPSSRPAPRQRRPTSGRRRCGRPGVTGKGVRIAVLDTGIDPTHPDLDDQDFRHWTGLLNPPKIVEARNFVGGVCEPVGVGRRARPRHPRRRHRHRHGRGHAAARRQREVSSASRPTPSSPSARR